MIRLAGRNTKYPLGWSMEDLRGVPRKTPFNMNSCMPWDFTMNTKGKLKFHFWAAAPKKMIPCRTRGDFQSIRAYVSTHHKLVLHIRHKGRHNGTRNEKKKCYWPLRGIKKGCLADRGMSQLIFNEELSSLPLKKASPDVEIYRDEIFVKELS